MYCSAGNIKMLPTESFFIPLEKRGLSQHTVENEVLALAGLTFYEIPLIGKKQESVVHIN